MLQKASLTLSHNVAIEFTQSGIRLGLNMLTWGFIDAARAEVERPKDVLSTRLDAPDERTICPEFHTITPAVPSVHIDNDTPLCDVPVPTP